MSTRSTLICGEGFHLFTDLQDPEGSGVHLSLDGEGLEYHASTHEVTVSIPADIWETIRAFPSMQFNLADKTNRDIQEKVEKEVDSRIAEHAAETHEGIRAFLTFAGSGRYGSVEDPREEQIARGIECDHHLREVQQRVLAAMAVHKKQHDKARSPGGGGEG